MAQVTEMIVAGRGHHFDPDVVDAFLAVRERFAEIAERLADTPEILERKASVRSGRLAS